MSLYFRCILARLGLYFMLFFLAISCSFFFMEILTRYLRTLVFGELPLYYAAIVTRDSDLIFSLAYLFALIACIQNFQQNHEIQTLQMAGLSPRSVLLPFYLFALLLTLASYTLMEYVNPTLFPWIYKKGHSHGSEPSSFFQVRVLPDGSRIIFQEARKEYTDLFWLQDHGPLWHCKKIIFEEDGAIGCFVDIFQKTAQGLEKISSAERLPLPFDLRAAVPQLPIGEETPLSLLISQYQSSLMTSDRARLETLLSYKIVYPWFPHFFATAFLPSCFFFQRQRRPYAHYLLAIFIFLFFFALMNTLARLAENYIVSPFFALIGIPLALQIVFTYRMWKRVPCVG